VLVNNAGIQLRRPLEQFSARGWRRVLDVNVTSAFLVARAVVPQLIERGRGKIVNTCSVTSELGRETIGPYTASKGALKLLTAGDVRRLGAARDPGERDRARLLPHRDERRLQEDTAFDAWLRARVPAGRWGEPHELGARAVFLASAASDFVNGQILYVDGGLLAVL
jgi:gluconate 5-dehydrogenase